MNHPETLLRVNTLINEIEEAADRPTVTKLCDEAASLLRHAISEAQTIDNYMAVCHQLPNLDETQLRAVHSLSAVLIFRQPKYGNDQLQ